MEVGVFAEMVELWKEPDDTLEVTATGGDSDSSRPSSGNLLFSFLEIGRTLIGFFYFILF